MIKIYTEFDAKFWIPVENPTHLFFVYPNSGSNFYVTGSFTPSNGGTEVYINGNDNTFALGTPDMYAIVDGIPQLVDTVEIADLNVITQSHNEKVLSAIDAMIEGRASVEVQELQIGGRTLKYIPIADLLKLREYYKKELQNENKTKKMGQSGRKINIRFR